MHSADLTCRIPPELYAPAFADAIDVDFREETLFWEIDEAAGTVRFLSVYTADRAELRELAAETPSIERFDTTPLEGDSFYGYVEMDADAFDDSLFALVTLPELIVVPPIVFTDGDRVELTILGDPAAFTGVLEHLPEAVDVEVERVSEHHRRPATVAAQLTARQLEAIESAAALGYYEVPREGSLADVAAELDCSESAASTLLRSAESTLVDVAIRR